MPEIPPDVALEAAYARLADSHRREAPERRNLRDRPHQLPADQPWPIGLPPEPPRDRVIEAVSENGAVQCTWKADADDDGWWNVFTKRGNYYGDNKWLEIISVATRSGWSLRSVPATTESEG